ERFHRSVLARRFIVLDDDWLALFLRYFDRQDLRFEETGLARTHRFLVTLERKLVLLFARNAIFFGDEFPGHAHVKIFVSVPQAVADHRVNESSVADAVAGAGL